jgi:mannose-P-dolichol utilization defect protein 1
MKFLLDIPPVMALANFIWGVAEEGDEKSLFSPVFCMETLPIMNAACWKQLVVKGLGIAIILGSFLNKTPIMVNILNSHSTEGLSRSATYGELLVYSNSAFYGLLQGYPLTAYGENSALLLQTLIIALMMWNFSKVSTKEKVTVVLLSLVYISVVTTFLPEKYYYLLMTSTWPLMLYSRGSQIAETYRCQHTGAQSIVTTSLNLAGSSVRIVTTVHEVGLDWAVLTGYGLSVMLNLIMFLQILYYKQNTEKFLADLKKKKKE